MDYENADNVFTKVLKKEAQEFRTQETMESFWESFDRKIDEKQAQAKHIKKRNRKLITQLVAVIAFGFILFGAGATATYFWLTGDTTIPNIESRAILSPEDTSYVQIEPPAVPLAAQRTATFTELTQELILAPSLVILGIIAGAIICHILTQYKRKRIARKTIEKIIAFADDE